MKNMQVARLLACARLRLTDPQRSTLAKIGKRLGRQALNLTQRPFRNQQVARNSVKAWMAK
jgi:hypothetical protein